LIATIQDKTYLIGRCLQCGELFLKSDDPHPDTWDNGRLVGEGNEVEDEL